MLDARGLLGLQVKVTKKSFTSRLAYAPRSGSSSVLGKYAFSKIPESPLKKSALL